MLVDERRARILEELEKAGFVGLQELVSQVGVSESTIRRDLEYLDRCGQIRRTRGGAAYVGESLTDFEERRVRARPQKRQVARRVAEMIELAVFLKQRGYQPRQVQDFIPAPMDVATCMHFTGLDPMTMKPVKTVQRLSDRCVFGTRARREDQLAFDLLGGQHGVRMLLHDQKILQMEICMKVTFYKK